MKPRRRVERTAMPSPLSIAPLMIAAILAAPAWGQDAGSTAVPSGDSDAPGLMARLGDETRVAYAAIRPCLVGVQLPLPPEIAEQSTAGGRAVTVSAQAMGVRVDDAGHVLLPVAVDPSTVPGGLLRAWSADGTAGEAAFVGVDPKTQLTLVRLKGDLASSVRTAAPCPGEPAAGSLVIVLAGLADSGDLRVWGGGRRDKGLVIDAAGRAAGFARGGQFVCLAEVGPIVDALRRGGRVDRPTFGMEVSEVRPDFPRTAHADAPPGGPSLRVEQVTPGGPAERAGVKPGDYVRSVAGRPVPDMTAFAIAAYGLSGKTEVALHRDGKALAVSVELPGG